MSLARIGLAGATALVGVLVVGGSVVTPADAITATANVKVKAAFALEPCVVPNVVGKTVRAAKSELEAALCSVGKVKMVASSKPKGHVVAQAPEHGKKLRQHAKVSLRVSRG